MNRLLRLFFALFFLAASAQQIAAQDLTQKIRGSVVDNDSKIPLIGATVLVVGSDPILGASTDIDGRFSVEGVPVGRHDLVIQYLGYEPKSIQQIELSS